MPDLSTISKETLYMWLQERRQDLIQATAQLQAVQGERDALAKDINGTEVYVKKMEQQLANLTAQLQAVTEERDHLRHIMAGTCCERAIAEVNQLEQQVTALRGALTLYGRHLDPCTIGIKGSGGLLPPGWTAPCSCGLDAALTPTPPQEAGGK